MLRAVKVVSLWVLTALWPSASCRYSGDSRHYGGDESADTPAAQEAPMFFTSEPMPRN
jgi:hypothetical protein